MRLAGEWRELPFWAEFQRVSRSGGSDDELLSVYRDHGVVPRTGRDDNNNRPSEDLSKYQLVEPGDLAINKMKAWQGSLAISAYRGVVSPAYFVYKPSGAIDGRFAHYLLRSPKFVAALRSRSKGIRPAQWDLDPDALRTIPLNIPAPPLQRAIAEYLDRETAEIDAFIADQEELIALVEERRRSVMTDLVTNPSGGGAWRLTTIGRTFRVLDCKHITAETGLTGDYPLASIREVGSDFVNLESARLTTHYFFEVLTEGGRQPRQGDLIVSRNASVGKVAMVPGGLPNFALGQDVSLIRQSRREARTDFLQYVLRSAIGVSAFEVASIGSTFKRINVDDIKAVRYRLPDAATQLERVRRAAEVLPPLDATIADARGAIALSKERRAALISAAVTGQIDVAERKRVLV